MIIKKYYSDIDWLSYYNLYFFTLMMWPHYEIKFQLPQYISTEILPLTLLNVKQVKRLKVILLLESLSNYSDE